MSAAKEKLYLFPEKDTFWRPDVGQALAILDILTEDRLRGLNEVFGLGYRIWQEPFFEKISPDQYFSRMGQLPSLSNVEFQHKEIELVNSYYYQFLEHFDKASEIFWLNSYSLLSKKIIELGSNPSCDYEIISDYVPEEMNAKYFKNETSAYIDSIYIGNMNFVLGFDNGDFVFGNLMDELKINLASFVITLQLSRCASLDEEINETHYLWNKIKQIEALTQREFIFKSSCYLD